MPIELTFAESTSRHAIPLRRAFWIGVALAAGAIALTASPQSIESALAAAAILIASVLPAGLWVYGKGKGIPLFPIYALTHAWTYGLPLLYEHPIVLLFPPDRQFTAGMTVAGYLLLGTAVWFAVARRAAPAPPRCIQLNIAGADYLFLTALAFGVFGTIALSGNWIALPAGVGSIISAIILAVQALATFVLSYELGARRLTLGRAALFIVLLVALLIVQLPSLLLINAMSIVAIAVLGVTLGSGRFPWIPTIACTLVFAFLHAGKSPMRDKYWERGEDELRFTPGPADYPAFFADWIGMSATHLGRSGGPNEEEGQSLLERASLMQLLLYVQAASPHEVPFLNGETYAVIPTLLVPRVLMPNKPASHEGTYILNIHYGFQTREQTVKTTIGFGLLNEAYANFGFAGVTMLATLLAIYYGFVGRWAANAPILSLRSLFAVVVASYSFQSEFAAGVYLAALFQSTVALLLIAVVFMRSAPVQPTLTPAAA